MRSRRVPSRLALAVLFAVCAVVPLGAQAQQGSITGSVLEGATGQPIPAAQVGVVGTTLGAQTNSEGQFTIRGVRPGTVEVRVLRVGFGEQTQSVTVTEGQTATVEFRMTPVSIALTPIVTTATGQQRRVEVANSIANVDANAIVQTRAVSNMGDLLVAKAAGVTVYPGVQTGAGIRIRIRGTSSMSLSNNPIYIIDGIRVEGTTGSSSVSVGGTTASRIGDINPEEIESIEIVRGPSAATLYGTDAANGVIVIKTKRGVAGRPQWTYYTEQTAITDRNDYPTAYRGWTGASTASNSTQCFLSRTVATSGACTQDSVTSYNLHDDPESTPYGVGYRQQHGLQLRGGSETVRYFIHGEWEEEDGVTKVPDFDRRWLAEHDLGLRPEMMNPNFLSRVTTRANISVAPADNLDISMSAGYISQDLRLPHSDDSGTAGIAANTFGGPGFKYNLNSAGDTLHGWREFTPRDVYEAVTTQGIERLITSMATTWSPREWLAVRGNAGVDYIHRHETQLCRFEDCTNAGDREGFKTDNRSNFFIYTLDAGATATRQMSADLESQTTVGVQFYRNLFTRNGAHGEQLAPGATTVGAGAVIGADETTDESRTLGAYLEQRMAFRDRLFVTGAIRSDRNSAFGVDFKTAYYPKLSVSWVLSDEDFFPQTSWLSQLRFRTAYGASGVQPGTTDAVEFYVDTRTIGESGDEVAGVVYSTLGNRNLKPERSTEIELGLDGSFLDNRISAELTYYDKNSTDALVEHVLPASLGTSATVRLENVGEVRNWGWEALLDAQLYASDAFAWNLNLNGSASNNELVTLGDSIPVISSSTIRQVQGYPLNGWWSRRLLSYNDANGNDVIELSEIEVSDTAEFHGYSSPRRELAVTNSLEFLGRRLRLSAMLDYKGGHKVYNNTERIRCSSRNNCSGLINPDASHFEQARVVMLREHSSRSVAGFFEDGDFIRLRELALTYTPAQDVVARFLRGRDVTATFAARNLGILWTKYTGVDPEAFGTTGDSPSSFQAFGPPTYFTFRLTLGL